ncbi:MAG: oligosaccharide flippase family protein [Pseudomonadota bacterium]
MSVARNVVANLLGQGWAAVMNLAFIPVYIQFLGVEAYGLIGFLALLQAWFTLLDLGMTPTLNREMARFTAGIHSPQSIRNLLRSLEILCSGLAALIGASIWAASDYLASNWLKAEALPASVVARAISLMALVVALRFVEGIYRGSLVGLQRQVWYNGANAVLATVRNGGAVLVLMWMSATTQAFFLWHALVSLLSIAVLSSYVHRVLPDAPSPPRFSRESLESVWKFARGMIGISFVAFLLTQVDKVLLSRLLSLELFGYYAFATTLAGVTYMLVAPVTTALFPSMVTLVTADDHAALASMYHRGAQLVTVTTAPAAILLCLFSGGAVFMWSGDVGLAANAAPLLSALVLGTFLNGLMWMPYQCQLAHGWTNLVFKANIAGAAVLVPAIFWAVPHYGAIGAAWIWVAVNIGLILVVIPLMHRRLIPREKWNWYVGDVLLPLGGAGAIALSAMGLQPESYQDRWHWLVFLSITGCLALAGSAALADRFRPRLLAIVSQRAGSDVC